MAPLLMMRSLVQRLGRAAPCLPWVCMAFIFTLSSIPGGEHDVLGYTFEVNPKLGNFLHIPAYFILATLWLMTFEARGAGGPRNSILAVVYATLFGALDEVHQYFVPGRCMDIHDVLTNLLGAALALLAWRWIRRALFVPRSSPDG